jgi:hypothetical protein
METPQFHDDSSCIGIWEAVQTQTTECPVGFVAGVKEQKEEKEQVEHCLSPLLAH